MMKKDAELKKEEDNEKWKKQNDNDCWMNSEDKRNFSGKRMNHLLSLNQKQMYIIKE